MLIIEIIQTTTTTTTTTTAAKSTLPIQSFKQFDSVYNPYQSYFNYANNAKNDYNNDDYYYDDIDADPCQYCKTKSQRVTFREFCKNDYGKCDGYLPRICQELLK